MKRFRARSGPFEEQLHFTTEEIDSMCLEALRAANLLPETPEPIRIERFIEKYFKCPVIYEDLGIGAMGCTAFRENGSIEAVFVSTRLDDGRDVSERRVRSTLAHEGGHCLMHPSLFMVTLGQWALHLGSEKRENIDFKARRILCRDSDIGAVGRKLAYDGRWWEWQANRAIGGLLLPSGLMIKALSPFLDLSSVTKSVTLPLPRQDHAARQLSETFEVNPAVVRIRLSEMFPQSGGQMGQMEF